MAFWVFVLTYYPGSYQAQQDLQSCGFVNPFFFFSFSRTATV